MQFSTSTSPFGAEPGQYKPLKPSLETSKAASGASQGLSANASGAVSRRGCFRLAIYIYIMKVLAGFLLVASLVLAAVSLERYLKYDHLYTEVWSECCGRYEMCMEMSWKGNVEHKPYPGDEYYFNMNTLDNQDIDEEAMIENTWWRLCEGHRVQGEFKLNEDAPWYCTCMEELYYRCNRIEDDALNQDNSDILGFHTRSEFLSRAFDSWNVSMWTRFAAKIVVAVGFAVFVLAKIPWKILISKAKKWAKPSSNNEEARRFDADTLL